LGLDAFAGDSHAALQSGSRSRVAAAVDEGGKLLNRGVKKKRSR